MIVEITRTTAVLPRGVFLQWDISTTEPGTHWVDVMRSGSPEGPWNVVATSLPNAYSFLDNKLSIPIESDEAFEESLSITLAEDLYYQIRVTPPSGPNNAVASRATPVEPGLDTRTRLLKRKVLRDASIAFRKLNGIDLAVLKRKHWGQRCAVCWDDSTKSVTVEHCADCFGTGFEGGYWNPIYLKGMRAPAPLQQQGTAEGLSQRKITQFKILDYPYVQPDDLIVDVRRDDRYIIMQSDPQELRGVTVIQTIAASLIARDAVEYDIPMQLNMPSLY